MASLFEIDDRDGLILIHNEPLVIQGLFCFDVFSVSDKVIVGRIGVGMHMYFLYLFFCTGQQETAREVHKTRSEFSAFSFDYFSQCCSNRILGKKGILFHDPGATSTRKDATEAAGRSQQTASFPNNQHRTVFHNTISPISVAKETMATL
ncbi:MAG: hypothetical protein M3Q07_17105 [Pseudobdellovibrionaceae bacterium]|nr:hypothetical protein [Pseudobdellovibrionaceae bacterium]